jgi:sulfur carrier protein
MPTIILNGQAHITQAANLVDLLDHLQMQQRRVAIERNGEIVPKSVHAETLLQENDRIEIVHAIGGG